MSHVTELAEAKKKIVSLVSRTNCTSGIIKEKLTKMGFDDETASTTADWALESSLINDSEYAESLVRGMLRRGYGKMRIEHEFKCRKVPLRHLDGALREAGFCEEDETDRAYALIEARLGGNPPDNAAKRRLYSFLASRGFSSEIIRAAISKYRKQTPNE